MRFSYESHPLVVYSVSKDLIVSLSIDRQPDRFWVFNPIDFSHRYSFYFLQKKLAQNQPMYHKNHQYQHTSDDPTFRHRHRTRERSNQAKRVLQAGRTGCKFVWTVSRISERSPGECVLCRPMNTSEAHRAFP